MTLKLRYSAACVAALLASLALFAGNATAKIITRLPTTDHVVALTFDACQAGERMALDHSISDYLVSHAIPFTVFLGGKFVRDNAEDIRALAQDKFIEFENHSWSHNNSMPKKPDAYIRREVLLTQEEIEKVTGRKTGLFRFPSGNSDERTTHIVEGMGYRIVHWRWPSGDPVRQITADMLVKEALAKTRPGDILIFHINGRGWNTGKALPGIVEGLKNKGYRFVLLRDYLRQGPIRPAPEPLAL
jgi:peptidoglycan-N-acetylglucosamine deacetylase